MANTIITTTLFAKQAAMILENSLVAGNLAYRGYESEFKEVNGYTPGNTINIRRPNDFTIRSGRTASSQDVTEGSIPFKVDTQIGIDFEFTSQELTQNVTDFTKRVIKPAMVQIANKVDRDILGLATQANSWVGTPGTAVGSATSFFRATERLDKMGVPSDGRGAVLSPSNYWAIASSATALFMNQVANDAYRDGMIGKLGGVDTYMSQNVASLTRGTAITATINSLFTSTYASTLNSKTASIALEFAASRSIAAGDVFSISNVFAVNPVTKATQSYLQQFVALAAAGGTAAVTVTITPPLITTGAFQTVSAAPTASSVVTFLGTASNTFDQDVVFHKNAMGLCIVPMIAPDGVPNVARQSYKGVSVRVVPFYDGTSDINKWRLDVLYGVRMLDERLITRLAG